MSSPEQLPSDPRWTAAAFRMGAMSVLPFLPGIAAFSMAYGTVAARQGFSLIDTLVMTGTVYAGLAQMIALENWPTEFTTATILVLMAIMALVNLRYLLIGATMRSFFAGEPAHKVYPTLFLLSEPNWLLTLRYQANGGRDPAFLLGGGVAIWVVWVVTAIPGYLAGAAVGDPQRFGLDLVVPAFFAAMLVPLWRGPRRSFGWIAAAGAAVAAQQFLGGFWYLIFGVVAGFLAGAFNDD